MNITSNNTMIYRKDDENGKVHYRAGLSTKNITGNYENGYIDIRLPKDISLENKTKINITKGFLSFYNYVTKDGRKNTIWYVVVQEYTTNVEVKQEKELDPYEEFGKRIEVEQQSIDLPF